MRPEGGADVSKGRESVKHLVWHGNAEEVLERLGNLIVDLSLIYVRCTPAEEVAAGFTEFETYIRNNCQFIPNFGERRRHGGTISRAFVESTINQAVGRRLVKKPQMHWRLRGAQILLQIRTEFLNDELEEVFRRWYRRFRAKADCPRLIDALS